MMGSGPGRHREHAVRHMSLPALTATGATLHVAPARAGLTMRLFMLGFAIAPLLCGPIQMDCAFASGPLYGLTIVNFCSAAMRPSYQSWKVQVPGTTSQS